MKEAKNYRIEEDDRDNAEVMDEDTNGDDSDNGYHVDDSDNNDGENMVKMMTMMVAKEVRTGMTRMVIMGMLMETVAIVMRVKTGMMVR